MPQNMASAFSEVSLFLQSHWTVQELEWEYRKSHALALSTFPTGEFVSILETIRINFKQNNDWQDGYEGMSMKKRNNPQHNFLKECNEVDVRTTLNKDNIKNANKNVIHDDVKTGFHMANPSL